MRLERRDLASRYQFDSIDTKRNTIADYDGRQRIIKIIIKAKKSKKKNHRE